MRQEMAKEPAPFQLGLAHDQWQVQLTGLGWMQHLGLTIEGMADPEHRSHNDAATAVCWAGLRTAHHAAILLCNALLGPWGKCAFFHGVIAEGRNSVAGMQPDNPWLLRYWPRIVKDNGWEEVPGIYNREAREKWLAEELPDHPCFSNLGVKVKPVAWLSFHRGFSEFLDKHLNTRGMLLGRMSARSGDIKCVEDLFISAMDTAGFEPSDGNAASSLSVTDAGPSKRKATKEAKANVDDLRGKMNNTVGAAARVGRALVALGMRMVALGTRSENGVGSFEDELKETDETLTEDDEWSICSLADSAVEGKKNLNDASRKELSKIPTIGKVLSKRIHEAQPYRDWIDVRALPQVGPVRIAELQKAFYLVHTHS